MDEINERIISTRDAVVDADKEFDTTAALLTAVVKNSQYFGLIGQLGTAQELRDQLKELISIIDYLDSGACFDYESTGRAVDQFIKLKIAYHLFIKTSKLLRIKYVRKY